MISKRFNQIITLLKDILLFVRMKFLDETPTTDKVIFVDFKNPNLYHRYFYNLLTTFKIAGYEIIYPMSFSKFRNLRNGDVYLALLFKEKGFLSIKNNPSKAHYIILKDDQFSADYYKTFFENNNLEKNSFHVPMSFHPYMYSNNLWNIPIKTSVRKNAIFTFGNFDREAYKEIHKAPFKVINRAELIESFSKQEGFISVKSKNELNGLVKENKQYRFIFAEKENVSIPMENVREYLSKFRYFLCCPGVFAPLSHNFVEALSVGTVPIIQQSYADLIYPKLQHQKNAFIFQDWDHLLELINNEIFKVSDQEYAEMNEQVQKYYDDYLQPESVAENIIKQLEIATIFLNASERSVKLISKKI